MSYEPAKTGGSAGWNDPPASAFLQGRPAGSVRPNMRPKAVPQQYYQQYNPVPQQQMSQYSEHQYQQHPRPHPSYQQHAGHQTYQQYPHPGQPCLVPPHQQTPAVGQQQQPLYPTTSQYSGGPHYPPQQYPPQGGPQQF
uniref:Uncharacterized protein n=1 Tax=Panagrolaimus superbus TaxID=310955 RepID=A0A914YB88_9BILA